MIIDLFGPTDPLLGYTSNSLATNVPLPQGSIRRTLGTYTPGLRNLRLDLACLSVGNIMIASLVGPLALEPVLQRNESNNAE